MADDLVVTEVTIEGRKVKLEVESTPTLEPWDRTAHVGKPLERVDARAKVTGAARYAVDVHPPGLLEGAILRSPHAHARVTHLDVRPALAIEGVAAALTPEDVRGIAIDGAPVLTRTPVHMGAEIACVVARDRTTARRALGAIQVEYEPLPTLLSPADAIETGRFTGGGFDDVQAGKPTVYARGDVDAALSRAHAIVRETYHTAAVSHASLEGHVAVASFEGDDLTVYESTQGVFFIREGIARALSMPLSRVRVICPYMGGGFGAKAMVGPHTILAVLLARKTGRPVRFALSRREEQAATYYRPASTQEVTLAADATGKLLAIDLAAYLPVGQAPNAHWWASAGGAYQDAYDCPSVRTAEYALLTHIPSPCPFRAPGHANGAFALEQAIDELALRLGRDPLELRLANMPAVEPTTGERFASNAMRRVLEAAAHAIGWAQRPRGAARQRRARADGQLEGWGLAFASWSAGGGPPAGSICQLASDGSITLLTGAADLGTGTRTVLAQIVAEELGTDPARVRVMIADTATAPYCMPSFGSMTLASSGPAARQAAHAVRVKLLRMARAALGIPAEETTGGATLELVDGRARLAGQPRRSVEIAALARSVPERVIVGHGRRGANPAGLALQAFAAHACRVAVDPGTGRVTIIDYVAAHDSGRVINPLTWAGQIQGAITQGLGYGLYEERALDPNTGAVIEPGFMGARVPTMADAPWTLRIIDAGLPCTANDIGVKGIGEPPIIPVAPAIANAVADALDVRIRQTPLVPRRILEALAAREEESSRPGAGSRARTAPGLARTPERAGRRGGAPSHTSTHRSRAAAAGASGRGTGHHCGRAR